MISPRFIAFFLIILFNFSSALFAFGQRPVFLRESIQPGKLFRVNMRVDLKGSLSLPPEKGASSGKQITISGTSAINYDERILTLDKKGETKKSIRWYRQLDFQRKIGDQIQENSLRPKVRRLVVLRHRHVEVPFSPDGPLTWSEIDLVRTDVFTPALTGLLPLRAVSPGDRWSAATSVIKELTDFESVDSGVIACKFDHLTTLGNRRHARVSFSGTIKGTNEDGKSKQQIDGYFYFDLESSHLGYLSMRGVHFLLDQDGKAMGKIEGTFVVTRQPLSQSPELSDSQMKQLTLEPNEQNSLLLYNNPELGLKFLYPRKWRVAGVRGTQLGLDERDGSGILLTLEPLANVPSGTQFLKESRKYLQKQKVKIVGLNPVRIVQQNPRIEAFALDIQVRKQKVRMYYLVIRQELGGIVVAGRLQMKGLAEVQSEVDRIARSMQLTKRPK